MHTSQPITLIAVAPIEQSENLVQVIIDAQGAIGPESRAFLQSWVDRYFACLQ